MNVASIKSLELAGLRSPGLSLSDWMSSCAVSWGFWGSALINAAKKLRKKDNFFICLGVDDEKKTTDGKKCSCPRGFYFNPLKCMNAHNI
jgi:hypothetical protein